MQPFEGQGRRAAGLPAHLEGRSTAGGGEASVFVFVAGSVVVGHDGQARVQVKRRQRPFGQPRLAFLLLFRSARHLLLRLAGSIALPHQQPGQRLRGSGEPAAKRAKGGDEVRSKLPGSFGVHCATWRAQCPFRVRAGLLAHAAAYSPPRGVQPLVFGRSGRHPHSPLSFWKAQPNFLSPISSVSLSAPPHQSSPSLSSPSWCLVLLLLRTQKNSKKQKIGYFLTISYFSTDFFLTKKSVEK